MLAALVLAGAAAAEPIPIRVVVVTTFEIGEDTGDKKGEFQNWVERFPLREKLPFPQGYRGLRYNPEQQVLGIVTGEGKSHAAASIMALGMDPRFDLGKAYWILAGIAGIDPDKASVGSAAWAGFIVDGDLAYEIDGREIPADWPTGIVPYDRALPYQPPVPPDKSGNGEQVFRLNAGLVDWAYRLTAAVELPDTANLKAVRAAYAGHPEARRPPRVLKGDTLTCDRFWLGARMTAWSERWVAYWTHGQGVGVTSAEEDSGYLQALTFLAAAHRADLDRVLDLRAASDFESPPDGMSAASLLAGEAHGELSGYEESIEAAYLVGSKVVRELAGDWTRYGNRVPSGKN